MARSRGGGDDAVDDCWVDVAVMELRVGFVKSKFRRSVTYATLEGFGVDVVVCRSQWCFPIVFASSEKSTYRR